MKRVTILAAIGLLVAAALAFGVVRLGGSGERDRAPADGATEADTDQAGEAGGEEEGGPQAPADYLTLKFTSGREITQAQVDRSIRQAQAVPQGARGSWQLVGPTNVGGRITDLAVDPRHRDTVYTAASGGGVWKSTDAGDTWTPAWPTDATQTIGALAIGSDGTMWAGTGEANPSGGGLTYFGDGVYKSSDGGTTWQHWGLTDSAAIGRIAVDPTDPDRVYVAASGSISRSVGQRGIYRVTNGGKDWKQVLAPPDDTTGGVDIAIDPSNPRRIFAALWDHKRNNGARVYGGVGSGLYRSDDGGDSWTRLENIVGPTNSYDQTGSGLTSDPSLGASVWPSRRRTRSASAWSSGARTVPTRASTSPRTAVTPSRPAGVPARPAATSGGSAGSGSIPTTRTTCSRRTSACANPSTAGRRGRTRTASTPTSTRWSGTRTSRHASTSATTAGCTARTPTGPAAVGCTPPMSRSTSPTTWPWPPTTRRGWPRACRTTAACARGRRRRSRAT